MSGERVRGRMPAGVRAGLLEGEASKESPLEKAQRRAPLTEGSRPGAGHSAACAVRLWGC